MFPESSNVPNSATTSTTYRGSVEGGTTGGMAFRYPFHKFGGQSTLGRRRIFEAAMKSFGHSRDVASLGLDAVGPRVRIRRRQSGREVAHRIRIAHQVSRVYLVGGLAAISTCPRAAAACHTEAPDSSSRCRQFAGRSVARCHRRCLVGEVVQQRPIHPAVPWETRLATRSSRRRDPKYSA